VEAQDERIAAFERAAGDAIVVLASVAEHLQRQAERLGEEGRDGVVAALRASEDLAASLP
jgi:hypothetical protein